MYEVSLASWTKQNTVFSSVSIQEISLTIWALIETTDLIKDLLDEKHYGMGILTDFKKAFDTVDYEILLDK